MGNHHLQRERLVLQGGERLRGRGGDVAVGVAHPGVGGERRTVDERERLVAGEVRPFGRRGDVHARAAVLNRVEVADQPVLHVERRGQGVAPRHAAGSENGGKFYELFHLLSLLIREGNGPYVSIIGWEKMISPESSRA